ncbi:MAG: leucine-rich repeat domain-containing protein [Clostridia bacterium]|nr:leucine-rich repeat domain-containing protein [Clostridia bacterium]
MKKRIASLLLTLCLLLTLTVSPAEAPVSLDALMEEIERESKGLNVSPVTYEISADGQSIYIDSPKITGNGTYTIAYNIYDSDSNPVNYFYSFEDRVAATPGYGGLFNVFVVVDEEEEGRQYVQDIGWHQLKWPAADRLTVGRAAFELSPDGRSIFVDRPEIRCKSGSVTVAYNIYDAQSNPVNYFYSTQKRVAATPGYSGTFNVFIVVTDTETGETDIQNIGWQEIGGPPEQEEEEEWPVLIDGNTYYDLVGNEAVVTGHPNTFLGWPDPNINIRSEVQGRKVTAITDFAFQGDAPGTVDTHSQVMLQQLFSGKLTLPDTLRVIGECAFEYMWLSGDFSIGSNLTRIGDRAFFRCEYLKATLNLNPQCEIGSAAFSQSGVTVTQNGQERWYRTMNGVYYRYDGGVLSAEGIQAGVAQLKLAEKVNGVPLTAIADYAFKDCTDLKGTLTIPATVTRIGDSAFDGCTGLTALKMEGTLEELGSFAFRGCENLKGALTLSDEISWGFDAFDGTLLEVTNESGTQWLTSVDGIYYLYTTSYTGVPAREVIQLAAAGAHPSAKGITLQTEVRGKQVTEVGYGAFNGRKDLTGPLVIPEGYTRIRFAAFAGCTGLTGSLVIPRTMGYIDGDAFRGCTGFTGTVVIPKGCGMGLGVFSGTNLTVVREE